MEGYVTLSAREEPENAVILGSSWGKSQICTGGLWERSSGKVMCMKVQLKCHCSKKNKQGKIKMVVYLENFDFIAMMET